MHGARAMSSSAKKFSGESEKKISSAKSSTFSHPQPFAISLHKSFFNLSHEGEGR